MAYHWLRLAVAGTNLTGGAETGGADSDHAGSAAGGARASLPVDLQGSGPGSTPRRVSTAHGARIETSLRWQAAAASELWVPALASTRNLNYITY